MLIKNNFKINWLYGDVLYNSNYILKGSIAEILCLSSLGVTLTEEMKNAILGCYPYSEKVAGRTIELIVENWEDHKFNGFDLKLIISISRARLT